MTASVEVSRDSHMPQLDGLRCYAVLLVLWSHAVGGWPRDLGPLGIGIWGVWLFFVLSGFLITGILLRARRRAPHDLGAAWRAFYARRVLRIFPLYYLVVLIGAAVPIGASFRADLPWHLAYLGNWLMAWHPRAFADPAGPVWSLGVEEQFYLVWPALVLFAPLTKLPRVFAALAVGAIVFREAAVLLVPVLTHAPLVPSSVIIVTPSNFDSLACGALLAWYREHSAEFSSARRRATRRALRLGVALAVALTLATYVSAAHARVALVILAPTAVALISVWLVDRAADGFAPGSVGARMLGNRAVRYIGTISYGIYLWHYPLLWTLAKHGAFARLPSGALGNVAIFATISAVTLVVASLSWYLYERPINALKRRFAYAPRGASVAGCSFEPRGPHPEPGRPRAGPTGAALDVDALPTARGVEH